MRPKDGTWRVFESTARPGVEAAGEGVKLVIGGTGEKRTLRMVAEYADDWNATTSSPEVYAAKADVLARHCEAVGRDPVTVRRSIMTGHIIGRDRAELRQRAAKQAGR